MSLAGGGDEVMTGFLRKRSNMDPSRDSTYSRPLAFPAESPNLAPMLRCCLALIGVLLPCAAGAEGLTSLSAHYATYAAGLHVADIETGVSTGSRTYQMSVTFRTTGVAGFFYSGSQTGLVRGSWQGSNAVPEQYIGEGTWRGAKRLADIEYEHGQPKVRQLVPSNQTEREPVPENLQANTIDMMSAMMQLVHAAGTTGRCEGTVRSYEGRRLVEIEAHTIGPEVLPPSGRSSFAGRALRCDFSTRLLAGFDLGGDRARASRPMRGSAWLAPVVAGGAPMPVRVTFETRWVGDAITELTSVDAAADITVAGSHQP
jgi:hypothetical protein